MNPTLSRYSWHELSAEVGVSGQNKLRSARVLRVGAGGLGLPVISYLAAVGIGTIRIVDYERVDITNLQRQMIHTESSIGELITVNAANYVSRLSSAVQANLYSERLSEVSGIETMRNYDIVIDGSDNFSTRYLVSDACAAALLFVLVKNR